MFDYKQTKEDISKCLENKVDGEKDPLLPNNSRDYNLKDLRSAGFKKAINDYGFLQKFKRSQCEKLGLKIARQEELVDLSSVFGQETAQKLNNDFSRDFKQLVGLMKELKQRGRESGEPVLLIIANRHTSARSFALNSLAVRAASVSGVENLYVESNKEILEYSVKSIKESGTQGHPALEIIKESSNQLGGSLNVYPALLVDPNETKARNMLEKRQQWDRRLVRGVNSVKEDGVLILGNDHLLNASKSLSQNFEIELVAAAEVRLEYPKKFLEQKGIARAGELAKKADRVRMHEQLKADGVKGISDPSLEKGIHEQEKESHDFTSNPEKVKQFQIDDNVHYMSYPQIRQLVENAMKKNLP